MNAYRRGQAGAILILVGLTLWAVTIILVLFNLRSIELWLFVGSMSSGLIGILLLMNSMDGYEKLVRAAVGHQYETSAGGVYEVYESGNAELVFGIGAVHIKRVDVCARIISGEWTQVKEGNN